MEVLRHTGWKLERKFLQLVDRAGKPIKGAKTGDQPRILASVELFYHEDTSTIVREHTVHEYSKSIVVMQENVDITHTWLECSGDRKMVLQGRRTGKILSHWRRAGQVRTFASPITM